MDFNLMDELLYDGFWLETTDGSNIWQPIPSASTSLNSPLYCFPSSDSRMDYLDPNPHQKGNEETERSIFDDTVPLGYSHEDHFVESQMQNQETTASSGQSKRFLVEGTESNRRLWIAPSKNPRPRISVKKRLMQAIEYLKETTRDRDVLIQIWVPIKRGGRHVLTTNNQPFSLNPNCKSLADYRDVSRSYQFSAEEDSKEFVGLPGRVFLKKLPEWTPDVRFFKREEYPRIKHAQQYNVSGSLAVPVFERGSGTCLGVVEIVTTTQKANYQPELENVRRALEAVDLRSFEILSPPKLKDCNDSYQTALAEIRDLLKAVCDTYELPLAQTWAPCVQQGRGGCRHSDENYTFCVSTIDSACYLPNPKVLDFHKACSEHHLLRGEGVAGGAFMTNQLCFATDITAFSKTEYPLSHHARMFGLHAAVAIRFQSIHTGLDDFVLEFFLPLDCKGSEEQKQILNSLSSMIQQVCHSLRVVTDQEPAEESAFLVGETVTPSGGRLDEETNPKLVSSPSPFQDESSLSADIREAQRKGKSVAISMEYQKEEPEGGFKVTIHRDSNEAAIHHEPVFSEQKQLQQDSGTKRSTKGDGDISSVGWHRSSGARKTGEKRQTKTEKTISLEVLRQYFAGSLNDAAKSIGVCPTTLKRICRQHGINRWPSRKIKKVGHSLRKLQRVIDSVQGAEGAIQLSSFYTSFPELSSPNLPGTSPLSTSKMRLNTQPEGSLVSPGITASKSHSSSGSHSSSSTGTKQPSIAIIASGTGDGLSAVQPGGVLKRVCSNPELHDLCHEETKFPIRSHSHNFFSEHPWLEAPPPLPRSSSQLFCKASTFRVKATWGEVKIRFSMQQNCCFGELQREIVGRFNVDDISKINLKYLDDESEWVLLMCDADLEECMDIHRSSGNHTIKLSLHQASHTTLGSALG
ncbi:unnamed protein product [Ilex paraguariensis]|uniref:Uncharacterized protein n=1 Tax=Ilex paraguariensis TaxID=185542 RepID=A0ABC8UEC3_9AQUA